ncbi:AraC family transcriptional regulator [Viridibacterium curvum]|uniref:AraC family transcriptional regulator n=1 Tax=Viridibacterium curvum TaxID=1101404 RepID=A0ABP9QS60_9RHOO
MKTTTRERYAERIERVVRFLNTHLDADIDLHRLAEEAALSPYHFHRVYHAHMGETVQETVRRMRLHRAAQGLQESSHPVARIAREAGFGSVPAFSRAFRAAYSLPPAAFRARRFVAFPVLPLPGKQEIAMQTVTIENRPALKVAALAHQGDYQLIGNSFDRLTAWAGGQGLLGPQTRSFGIYYDDPDAMPLAQLRSEACLTVPDTFEGMGDYRALHTPGGRCAVLEFVGPYVELHKAYTWLFREWLPGSGEEPGDAPAFEEYLNDPRDTPQEALRTAICIPLKPR